MTGGIEAGATLETAMLSPCVGGFVRTWTEYESRLWSVADPDALSSVMGEGILARTLREERRFREVGLLHEPSGTLLLQPRRPKRVMACDSFDFGPMARPCISPTNAPATIRQCIAWQVSPLPECSVGSAHSARVARCSSTGAATPLSATGPIARNRIRASSAASTTAWLTTTSCGRATSAIRAAMLTVDP
jgi:hypothetical protein